MSAEERAKSGLSIDPFVAYRKEYPELDIEVEWLAARKVKGVNPGRKFFEGWLRTARADFLPAPKLANGGRGWEPPTIDAVIEFSERSGWSRSFGAHCWKLWRGHGWKHYGEPIASDEQWQCLMHSMEYNP